jgi:hypothetical protein
VRLSPRGNETTFKSAWAIFEALHLTVKGFVRLSMDFIPVYFLEERLGTQQLAKLTTKTQTGYRAVKAVLRPLSLNKAA